MADSSGISDTGFRNMVADKIAYPRYVQRWDKLPDGWARCDKNTRRNQPRNSKCACGSGKKHKHCCGRAVSPVLPLPNPSVLELP